MAARRLQYLDPFRRFRRASGLIHTFPDLHRILALGSLVNLCGVPIRLLSDVRPECPPVLLPADPTRKSMDEYSHTDLPDPKPGVFYLVPREVFTECPDRDDLAVPGRQVDLLDGSGRAHVGVLLRAGFRRFLP